MSELALELITECYETKNPRLDLGRCGLRDKHFAEGSRIDIALCKCTHLENLVLSNSWWDNNTQTYIESKNNDAPNQLGNLPKAIVGLTKLRTLISCGSSTLRWAISKISGLSDLVNLRYLDISFNRVENIEGLEPLPALHLLDLSNNFIRDIKGLNTLTNLRHLDLSHNIIVGIHGLDSLTALEQLYLHENQIVEVKGLGALINLKEIYLIGNKITEPNGLNTLINLKKLRLARNRISKIQGLDALRNLELLDLSYNRISSIKGLKNLTALEALDLSTNRITKIKGLNDLTALKRVNLSTNKITDINGLDTLTDLRNLYLSDNQIAEIKGLDNLAILETLNLSDNNIQDIYPLLSFIQSNKNSLKIVALRTAIVNIPGEINIAGNPLISPPLEIAIQGHIAIINYFRELEKQGSDYLYEAKMLIVGQPRAGKTSLWYKLFDSTAPLPEEDKTTRGIDIKRLSFDIKDRDGNPRQFYYNVWDFGGQHIYQTTHQFFLTHRSLYALVMDTGKDSVGNDDTTVNYWLQAVELLGGNSPMLLILNEKNERKISIDFPQKKARFDFLAREYNIDLNALVPSTPTYSLKREQEFEHLKKDIEIALTRLPLVGFSMPANWVKIREELQTMSTTTAYISLEKYKEICSRHKVVEYNQQLELSRIFHDLGVFLHFQDYGMLDDFIVLQNTWATDAVFTVLDNETVKNNRGRFTDTDLAGIWESKGYPAEVHKKLLGLMMQFELCYEVDKSNKCSSYIVPEMLSENAPDKYLWFPDNDLPLQYRYDFMPKGLLTRLIVRLHRYIYTENHQQWVWKTGVKIDGNQMGWPNTNAEITEAWDNKQLNIRIQGKFSKELMSIIAFEIDELNKNFFRQIGPDNKHQKSRWHKMIPCNCITCKDSNDKHFYDYSELLERKEYGKGTIECKKKPFDTVNIYELMDGVFSKEKEVVDSKQRDGASKIFISYSKDDLALVNKFIEHLSALQLDGRVSHWYCTELMGGTRWHSTIQKQFDQSDIVIFMVSPNFMKTQYIHEHEIRKAFERQAKDSHFKIIPIILDFCKWTTANNNLGQFTALPYTAKPVVDFSNQNMAWYIITECLRLMIEKDLNPTGEDFYTSQALPKDVLKLLERIVAGRADA